MKRQRALPTRPAKKAKVADYDDQSNVEAQPESDPSDFTKAEKLKHGTQRLLVQLFPEGREGLKKRKEKAESVHGSEWGADSVNPDDEDDILDEEREEGEKEGKQFVMSRFFDPDTPNKDMPNMPMLDGSDLPSPLLRKMAPAEAKRPDLYNPSNLTGYVNNDPLTPGHDRTSSILPYSSPIADRSLKRQNSKLLHPQPKKAWSVELEKLKKVAAMKGEALERKARERGSTGSAEEDGKPGESPSTSSLWRLNVSRRLTVGPESCWWQSKEDRAPSTIHSTRIQDLHRRAKEAEGVPSFRAHHTGHPQRLIYPRMGYIANYHQREAQLPQIDTR